MTETSEADSNRRSRLRWVTLGEAIAIAALILSGLGLWREWNKKDEPPKIVVEKPTTIPLVLRGRVTNDGRTLQISPIENSHVLQSLALTAAGSTIEVGSEGELSARQVENAIGKAKDDSEGLHRVQVGVEVRYVEAGADKTATGSYVLTYRWEGGGLLEGRSLRLVGFNR